MKEFHYLTLQQNDNLIVKESYTPPTPENLPPELQNKIASFLG